MLSLRSARPQRLRFDSEGTAEDGRPTKKQKRKHPKTRRPSAVEEDFASSQGGGSSRQASGRESRRAGRGGALPGRKAFKSKKRYKRR